MRIIALRGGQSCGKTTTLNIVYDELISYPGAISTTKSPLGNPTQQDFECVVTLICGMKIGFYTMGDYRKSIPGAISNYAALNINILIVASNNNFHNHLMTITSYPFNVVDKVLAIPQNTVNNKIANFQDCGTILSLI